MLLLHPQPLSPGQSHCSLRSWFHGKSAYAHTLDTSATAAESTPVPQDQGAVVVLCTPDPRTLAPKLLLVLAHQARHLEGFSHLTCPPMDKKE